MAVSSKRFYVYVLARPDGTPFYVGKGTGRRVYQHAGEARSGHRCHKCNVIRKIWRNGGDVQKYLMLETDDEDEALKYECELITMYGRENLTNRTDGGEGVIGYRLTKPELKARSLRMKAWWLQPGVREAQQERIRQRNNDPEYIRTLTEAITERMRQPKWREWARDRLHTWWGEADYQQKRSEQARQQWADPDSKIRQVIQSDEMREVFSASSKRKWNEPEYRAKVLTAVQESYKRPGMIEQRNAAIRAAKQTPEAKQRASEGSKKAWARRKAAQEAHDDA